VREIVEPAKGAPVISNVDGPWKGLRKALLRDLQRDGNVLPIQVRLALKGLETLPYLSRSTYDRAGGLPGLEGAYVSRAATRAAGAAGLTSRARRQKRPGERRKNKQSATAKPLPAKPSRQAGHNLLESPEQNRKKGEFCQWCQQRQRCQLEFPELRRGSSM